jgi:hypothetical protein
LTHFAAITLYVIDVNMLKERIDSPCMNNNYWSIVLVLSAHKSKAHGDLFTMTISCVGWGLLVGGGGLMTHMGDAATFWNISHPVQDLQTPV